MEGGLPGEEELSTSTVHFPEGAKGSGKWEGGPGMGTEGRRSSFKASRDQIPRSYTLLGSLDFKLWTLTLKPGRDLIRYALGKDLPDYSKEMDQREARLDSKPDEGAPARVGVSLLG